MSLRVFSDTFAEIDNEKVYFSELDVTSSMRETLFEQSHEPEYQDICVLDTSGSMDSWVRFIIQYVLPSLYYDNLQIDKSTKIPLFCFESAFHRFDLDYDAMVTTNLSSMGGTYMTSTIHEIGNFLQTVDPSKTIRIITISDGEVFDIDSTLEASSKVALIVQSLGLQVQSRAVRFINSSYANPDTRALASVLQFDTEGDCSLIDLTYNDTVLLDKKDYNISTIEHRSHHVYQNMLVSLLDTFDVAKSVPLTVVSGCKLSTSPWISSQSVMRVSQNDLKGTSYLWVTANDIDTIKNSTINLDTIPIKIELVHGATDAYASYVTSHYNSAVNRAGMYRVMDNESSLTSLNKMIKLFSAFEASVLADYELNLFITPEEENTTLKSYKSRISKLQTLKKIQSQKHKSLTLSVASIANDANIANMNSKQKADYLRNISSTTVSGRALARRGNSEDNWEEVIVEEMKNLFCNLGKLDHVDDSAYGTSFVSQCTTLEGLRYLRDEGMDLFEGLEAIDCLALLPLVGVAVRGKVGDHPDPYTYMIHEVYPNHVAVCDLIEAKKNNYNLRNPGAGNDSSRYETQGYGFYHLSKYEYVSEDGSPGDINSCAITLHPELYSLFFQHAPRTLSMLASICMRNVIAEIPKTYDAIVTAAISAVYTDILPPVTKVIKSEAKSSQDGDSIPTQDQDEEDDGAMNDVDVEGSDEGGVEEVPVEKKKSISISTKTAELLTSLIDTKRQFGIKLETVLLHQSPLTNTDPNTTQTAWFNGVSPSASVWYSTLLGIQSAASAIEAASDISSISLDSVMTERSAWLLRGLLTNLVNYTLRRQKLDDDVLYNALLQVSVNQSKEWVKGVFEDYVADKEVASRCEALNKYKQYLQSTDTNTDSNTNTNSSIDEAEITGDLPSTHEISIGASKAIDILHLIVKQAYSIKLAYIVGFALGQARYNKFADKMSNTHITHLQKYLSLLGDDCEASILADPFKKNIKTLNFSLNSVANTIIPTSTPNSLDTWSWILASLLQIIKTPPTGDFPTLLAHISSNPASTEIFKNHGANSSLLSCDYFPSECRSSNIDFTSTTECKAYYTQSQRDQTESLMIRSMEVVENRENNILGECLSDIYVLGTFEEAQQILEHGLPRRNNLFLKKNNPNLEAEETTEVEDKTEPTVKSPAKRSRNGNNNHNKRKCTSTKKSQPIHRENTIVRDKLACFRAHPSLHEVPTSSGDDIISARYKWNNNSSRGVARAWKNLHSHYGNGVFIRDDPKNIPNTIDKVEDREKKAILFATTFKGLSIKAASYYWKSQGREDIAEKIKNYQA